MPRPAEETPHSTPREVESERCDSEEAAERGCLLASGCQEEVAHDSTYSLLQGKSKRKGCLWASASSVVALIAIGALGCLALRATSSASSAGQRNLVLVDPRRSQRAGSFEGALAPLDGSSSVPPTRFPVFARGRRCLGSALHTDASEGGAGGAGRKPLLEGRDACEAACTQDPRCSYYLWKDDPRTPSTQYECSLFKDCAATDTSSSMAAVYRREGPPQYTTFLKGRLCRVSPLLEAAGNEADGLLLGRAVCEAACTADEACAFYAWEEDRHPRHHRRCATYALCDASVPNHRNSSASVYRKDVELQQDDAAVSYQSPIYYTMFLADQYCEHGLLHHSKGDAPEGIRSSRSVCEAACTIDPLCKFYLWKDEKGDSNRYHCATFSSCNSSHAYGDGATASVFRKEVGALVRRRQQLAEQRALAWAARLREEAAAGVPPSLGGVKLAATAFASPAGAGGRNPRYTVAYQGRICDNILAFQDVHTSAMMGLVAHRDVCEAACTSDPRCRFYFWRDDPKSHKRFQCKLLPSCDEPKVDHDSSTALVFQKESEVGNAFEEIVKGSVSYSFFAADAYCDTGVINNWEHDHAKSNIHTREGCEAKCSEDDLCSFYLWKEDKHSKFGRYHCATFSACPSWHAYADGNKPIIYKKDRGEASVFYEMMLANQDCEAPRRQEAQGVKKTGLLTSHAVCEAACSSDPACLYYLWKDAIGGSPIHCATFATCPSSHDYPGGFTATVFRKRRGSAAEGGIKPLSWKEAEHHAQMVVERMTASEKQSVLNGRGWQGWNLQRGFYIGNTASVPRLGVPSLRMQDSGNGFRASEPSLVGTVTVWPSPLAVASTWDEALASRQAAAIGREFVGKGANVILGPAVNVHRVARAGRNFEYLSGEDPYLGARLARGYVKAVQREGVMAVVKHFAFNEQETNRMGENSEVSDSTAWELYYPPFEAAIEAGATSVMCAYNKVNDTYSCENEALLQRDLRGSMGFRGFVMSDWGATHSTSVSKGLDMDQPGSIDPWFSKEKLAHVKHGLVDRAVQRTLAATFRLRLHEYPGCDSPNCLGVQQTDVTSPANRALAQEVATSSVVLLKNDGILPFEVSRVKKLAIVGRAAATTPAAWGTEVHGNPGLPRGDYYSGGGSGHVHAADVDTALDGITRRARDANIEVLASADDDIHAALRLAHEADAVVVVAGTTTVENMDRSSFRLDGEANHLIFSLARVRPTIVLMQASGAVITPWRHKVAAAACLFLGGEATGHAWAAVLFGDVSPEGKLPIMLPASKEDAIEPVVPSENEKQHKHHHRRRRHPHPHHGHHPPHHSHGKEGDLIKVRALREADAGAVVYEEGVFTSYRSRVFEAAFPFGHGLSYTKFRYEVPTLPPAKLLHSSSPSGSSLGSAVDGGCAVARVCACTVVVNVGSRPGREVAQAYLEFPNVREGSEPRLQLRGFVKTALLQPDGHEEVCFAFSERDLSVYNPGPRGIWRLQDRARLHVGPSSADLRHSIDLAIVASAADKPHAHQSAGGKKEENLRKGHN